MAEACSMCSHGSKVHVNTAAAKLNVKPITYISFMTYYILLSLKTVSTVL